MDGMARSESWRLRWGAIFAGAAVAIAVGWTGELLGGLLAMIEPGESSGWGWFGGLVTLAMLMLGTFAGGFLAARSAGVSSRAAGALHGIVVWGLLGTTSALLFAVLGGNIALVSGGTAGAIRLALGFAMLGLLGALFAATLGGIAGQSERADRMLSGRRRRRREVIEAAPETRYGVGGPEVVTRTPPLDEGPRIPPSVH